MINYLLHSAHEQVSDTDNIVSIILLAINAPLKVECIVYSVEADSYDTMVQSL